MTTATETPDTGSDRWVLATRAAEIVGVDRQTIYRLAEAGHLTVREVPCSRRRYLVSDCERLAREAVRPASASPAAGTTPRT